MKSGLMWYDPDPKKPASLKIEEAAQRYREKFGTEPNACHVCPGEAASHDRMLVVPNRWIRPHYFWLGVDEHLPPAPDQLAARRPAAVEPRRRAVGVRAASVVPPRQMARHASRAGVPAKPTTTRRVLE